MRFFPVTAAQIAFLMLLSALSEVTTLLCLSLPHFYSTYFPDSLILLCQLTADCDWEYLQTTALCCVVCSLVQERLANERAASELSSNDRPGSLDACVMG